MKAGILIKSGYLMIYGPAFDSESHRHNSIQVTFPLGRSQCTIKDNKYSGAIIIDTFVEHLLVMEKGIVFLFEPKSHLGKILKKLLAGKDSKLLQQESSLRSNLETGNNLDELLLSLSSLFQSYDLDDLFDIITSENNSYINQDKRIEKLIHKLDSCIDGESRKSNVWRAQDIASELSLSEGRFLHLFSQEMGVAWRPYLKWRRLIFAIDDLVKGCSATEAAHHAGFSDSSHLSRTFRAQFGMTISKAIKIFN